MRSRPNDVPAKTSPFQELEKAGPGTYIVALFFCQNIIWGLFFVIWARRGMVLVYTITKAFVVYTITMAGPLQTLYNYP